VAWAVVPHGRRALARLSANFYKKPAERMAVIGITGTNGKSTTAFLVESILSAARRKSALIGTIEYHVAGRVLPAPHTTPEALELNRILHEALGQGATDAVMEVSSHALAQERVWGIPFDVAVFTNLTRDHLDYHDTMEAYFAAKRVLFAGCGTEPPRVAVTNVDDESGAKLADFSRKRGSLLLKYGWQSGDFHAEKVDVAPRGTRFDMVTPRETLAVFSPADWAGERLQHTSSVGGSFRARMCSGGDCRRSGQAGLRAGTISACGLRSAVHGGGRLRSHR